MPKKLIEVALPLEAINAEAASEKSIRHGHPSTLHLWWARRPLAACRAVLFASLVDDPSSHKDKFPTEKAEEKERQRLFNIIERLVMWENINKEELYKEAWKEILASTDGKPPPILDPFAGGGSIPLEAQRLGLETHASDLNPVAVLINKALIEIPPRFANRPPVNPKARAKIGGVAEWKGTTGLAEDVRYYGEWMREKAFEKIGHLYPKVTVPSTDTTESHEATVIAWLWARTVKCPNPACGAEMPLVRSFEVSKKEGKEAWVNPKINKKNKTIHFEVQTGKGKVPNGTVNRNGARCVCCDGPVPLQYIRDEGKQGRMGAQLMAIVVEGQGGRMYLSTNEEHAKMADVPKPDDYPKGNIPEKALGFRVQLYGMLEYADLFTHRQLTALVTFSNLVSEAIGQIEKDAKESATYTDKKNTANEKGLDEGGTGARAYAEAVGVYLAMLLDKLADLGNSLNRWEPNAQCPRQLFARQAVPMVWDYAEGNPLGDSSGSWKILLDNLLRSLNAPLFAFNRMALGHASQKDASQISFNSPIVISTDPPYYDNIGYADLSDFFYIWLRRSLRNVYPKLFSTMLVPKAEELIATPFRFEGDKDKAKSFFETGMLQTFKCMRQIVSQDFPLTVYYAYKQTDSEEDEETANIETASSGWETMLQAIIKAGFSITGTWPLRTEMMSRAVAMNTNALASSIAIVCRPRPENAPETSRREFQSELREALKKGLHYLQSENVAPVDFAQASIGPGIEVYSKYREVLEASGDSLTVRQALIMINQELDAFLGEQSGTLDGESQFCVSWFEQYGFKDGPYGDANTLMRARMASEQKLKDSGILEAKQGKVRLKRRNEISFDWFIKSENIVWAIVQHLCHALDDSLDKCAGLMAKLPGDTIEKVKTLSYRIYQICERKGWADEALAYNNLVATWGVLESKTKNAKKRDPVPGELGF
jgi:putative DNA methylase